MFGSLKRHLLMVHGASSQVSFRCILTDSKATSLKLKQKLFTSDLDINLEFCTLTDCHEGMKLIVQLANSCMKH